MSTTDTNALTRQNSEIIRSMIASENELINHRVTWLTALQGLLFASLGFVWDKQNVEVLIRLLCILGILISILAAFALFAASAAIKHLYDWWEANKPSGYKGPDVIGLPLSGNLILHYCASWNWFPFLFIVAWIAVWIIR